MLDGVQVALARQADDALDALAKGLPPRELHVLVSESLAAVHGHDDDDRGFGHGGCGGASGPHRAEG